MGILKIRGKRMLPTAHVHVFQLLLLTVVFVSSCFITNCPPGGKKRSDSEEKTHQCEQCGPPGLGGRCFGPKICCSSQFGCAVGGPMTVACQQENRSPSLCHNQGASCDGSSETGPINGQCAASGICCTPETCTMDDECTSASLPAATGHLLHLKPVLMQHLEEPENLVSLVHGPPDPWFYRRRLLHSKQVPSEVRSSGEEPQGPPLLPFGSPRLADYF